MEYIIGQISEPRTYIFNALFPAFLLCPIQKAKPNPGIYELICDKLESENYHFIAMYLHSYIGGMWQYAEEYGNAQCHFEKAVHLAVEHKLYVPLLELSYFSYSLIEPIINRLPEKERLHFNKLHIQIQNDTEALILRKTKKTVACKSLNQEELKYIGYALLNSRNKIIAKIEKISESSVNKRFVSVYEKLGVSGRKELVDLVMGSLYENKRCMQKCRSKHTETEF